MNSKRFFKKFLSFILSFVLLFTAAPFLSIITAFAENSNVTSGSFFWTGHTGDCTYTLDEDKEVLTISGDGAMGNYNYYGPWGTFITKVIFESNVTTIGDHAFSYCSGLTNITIPDSVTYIGDYAFSDCSSLTSITIPNSVKYIGEHAFSGCSGLKNITIPNSLTNISNGVFCNCTGLTSINIPNGVKSIDSLAFVGCTALQKIVVDEKNSVFHSEGNCIINTKNKEIIYGCKNSVIPSDGSVVKLGDWSFYRCTGLKSITIPSSITSIGYASFKSCTGLTSITIPDSVTSISYNAFEDTNQNLIISTSENSVAYKHAKSKNIKLYLTKITRDISQPELETMQCNSNISVKITLKPTENYEYKCNNGNWQKSNIFDNLFFDKDYTFYQRLGKTNENVASSPSNPKIIHTKKKNASVPIAPEIISKTTSSITLKRIDGYEYSIDGTNWQTNVVFIGLNPIYEYTFYQRIAETEVFSASAKSVGVSVKPLKYDNKTIPKKPEILSKTDISITLKSITGYEYSIDNVNWQSDPVFENLKPDTEYFLYQRIAETDVTCSSISSEILVTKTYPKRYCTDCLNTGIGTDGKSCATCFGTGRYKIVGDADSDNEITDWDSVLCMRYLSGWDVKIFSEKCFDIDGDKRITDWDGVLFERYLAGWNQKTNIGGIVKGYPEHEHIYGDWIIDCKSTCVVEGLKYRICTICDISESASIPILPHSFTDWKIIKNATCINIGEKEHECTVCGYNETVSIPKTSHEFEKWITDKEYTCTENGNIHRICSVCGYCESQITKASHRFGMWIVEDEATCGSAGKEFKVCRICNHKDYRNIPKTNHHKYGPFIIDKAPTSTEDGYGHRDCTVCGHRQPYGIPKTG